MRTFLTNKETTTKLLPMTNSPSCQLSIHQLLGSSTLVQSCDTTKTTTILAWFLGPLETLLTRLFPSLNPAPTDVEARHAVETTAVHSRANTAALKDAATTLCQSAVESLMDNQSAAVEIPTAVELDAAPALDHAVETSAAHSMVETAVEADAAHLDSNAVEHSLMANQSAVVLPRTAVTMHALLRRIAL